ncbi:MAG: RNA-directed DNA polymerase, partial [Oscillospiraceae bacterium]
MSLVNQKYKQLKPTLDYLSDPVVLAQAWKKSHSYIRSHNWYADTLELDASTFNLEENIQSWSEELKTQTYKPSPLRLVPAPKGDIWSFDKVDENWVWRPKPKKDTSTNQLKSVSEPLRPLAHINIKDQTIATAIMMCVADAVETIQGATSDRDNVSSYGNRLFCKWDDKKSKANFGWGNSTTYSKYFKDYERFLTRTAKSANLIDELNQVFEGTQQVYEVQLDMSAFYDSIHRDELLSELRALVDDFYKLAKSETEAFWNIVADAFNWQWHKTDFDLNDCLKLPLKDEGLPQGLVASGFFANVYLIKFDNACHAIKRSRDLGVSIHDYCRYVDDIRLIISVDQENIEVAEDLIKKKLVDKLQSLLPKGIILNPEKTKIIKWNGEEGQTVKQMEGIQSLASGPIDMDSLEFAESSLDNLFTRAEASQFHEVINQHPLANIHQPKLEVREDTLLRFAANRWTKLFKSRRKLTNQKEILALDAAQEAVARRFVGSWSRNPALTLLLKKGIQLFPDKVLVETVWNALLTKINNETPIREKNIAYYCLAEICRFSATELKKLTINDIPKSINLNEYFEWVENVTIELLKKNEIPWYLSQQACLVLVGKPFSAKLENEPLLG